MFTPNAPLELLQARSRLKKLMPILPPQENGILPFSYPALEGLLFAVLLAPFEIDIGIWGQYLDKFLSKECLEAETAIDDIITISTEIQDALVQDHLFKTHTLSVPPTLSGQDWVAHPLYHWKTGYLTGFHLVNDELQDVSKSLKKSKAYREMRSVYVTANLKIMVALDMKIKEGSDAEHPAHRTFLNQRPLNRPLNEYFTYTLETLNYYGDLFAGQLDDFI